MLSSPLMMQSPRVNVCIDNIILQQVDESKFLGIIIDSKLKWNSQINQVIAKLCKLIGIFHKIRNSIPPDCLRLIYFSLAYPHLIYCAAIWGSAFSTALNSLFITQKKMLRVMSSSHRYAHTDPLFKNFRLLKSDEIITLQTHLFVHKTLHTHQLDYGFQLQTNLQNTRRQNNLVIPLCRTTHMQRYLTHRGAKQWNQLPENLKNIMCQKIFKAKIKETLFNL